MPRYEYKVVPAPKKPGKIKGVKGTDQKFAAELAGLMNQYGADGWEYQRTDTLPCEERHGLTGRTTTFQNMLIFCRKIATIKEATAPIEPVLPESEPALSIPSFRSTAAEPNAAPRLGSGAGATEGKTPDLGSAAAGLEPKQDIAAQ